MGEPLKLSTVQTIGLIFFSTSLITFILELYKLIYKRVKESDTSNPTNECDKIDPAEWWKRMTLIGSFSVISLIAGLLMYTFIKEKPNIRKMGLGLLFTGLIGMFYCVSSIFEVALFEGDIGKNALLGIGITRILILGIAVLIGLILMFYPSEDTTIHVMS